MIISIFKEAKENKILLIENTIKWTKEGNAKYERRIQVRDKNTEERDILDAENEKNIIHQIKSSIENFNKLDQGENRIADIFKVSELEKSNKEKDRIIRRYE